MGGFSGVNWCIGLLETQLPTKFENDINTQMKRPALASKITPLIFAHATQNFSRLAQRHNGTDIFYVEVKIFQRFLPGTQEQHLKTAKVSKNCY